VRPASKRYRVKKLAMVAATVAEVEEGLCYAMAAYESDMPEGWAEIELKRAETKLQSVIGDIERMLGEPRKRKRLGHRKKSKKGRRRG
jgi:hypothetical protein